jgi:hypothetical protein
VSYDPVYRFEKPQIQERIAATYDQIIDQIGKGIWAVRGAELPILRLPPPTLLRMK